MHLPDLLAPVAGRWLRRAQTDLDLVPQPADTPRRIVAGRDTDRVLLLGNGPVIGFGVRSHELALPGQLAERLQALTRRGALVDVVARRGLRVVDGLAVARRSRLSTYDAVVVAIGATDAAGLSAPGPWRKDLERLLDGLRAATSPGTAIVVLPITPVQPTGAVAVSGRRTIEAHARRLDRIAEDECASREDVDRLTAASEDEAPRSPADYGVLADRLAAVLHPRLDRLAAEPSNAGARVQRRGPDPEVLRQAALERTGLVGSGPNAALDRLLQQARDLFGVSAAAVTLIDGDRVVFKASLGMSSAEVERSVAPCNRTIRRGDALVIPDLAEEPIAAHGSRFYAGHPLESPDGYRIGTLCILDGSPRREGEVDDLALIELAGRVQAELWREIEHGAGADDPASHADGAADTGSLRLPAASAAR